MAKALVERPSARNSALLVHPRGQLQQIIGGQGEQLAREHLEQRRGPLRVRDGLRQANHKRHLGRTVEDGAAGHHARQPLGPQRLGIHVRAAHAAEQHHHVTRPVPGGRELGERLRHTPRRHRRRVRRRHAARRGHGNLHLHAGAIGQKRALDLGFLAPRRQRHELGAEHLRLLEDAVAQRQHIPVAAEVVGQLDDALGVAAAHILQMTAVHRHVRAAEPVDALLRVADGAHARETFPGHALDHVHLQLIGVLELVHHHQLEAIGVRRLDGGMVAKRAGREGQQVVVVQQPRLALAARERARDRLRHIDQRRQLLLHQPATRLRGDCEVLFRQLSGLFAIRRVLAEVATGNGKSVHGRKHAPVRQPVGAAPDQLTCALQRILRCRQELVARGTGLDAVGQGICGFGDVHQLCQQLDRARRLGRRHHRRHAVGMRRGGLDQLPHHPLDRRRARTDRVHVERCEQRIKALRRNAFGDRDQVVPAAEHLLKRCVQKRSHRGFVGNLECGVEPQLKRMCAKDARAHAMDGGYPRLIGFQRLLGHAAGAQRALHARFDLARRLRREGDSQNLVDIGQIPAFQRMHDAAGERERFAAAGAGAHRQRLIKRVDALFLADGQRHGYPLLSEHDETGHHLHASGVSGRGRISPANIRSSAAATASSVSSSTSANGLSAHMQSLWRIFGR